MIFLVRRSFQWNLLSEIIACKCISEYALVTFQSIGVTPEPSGKGVVLTIKKKKCKLK